MKVLIDEEDYYPVYTAYTGADFVGRKIEVAPDSYYLAEVPDDVVARWRQVREDWKRAQREIVKYVRTSEKFRNYLDVDWTYDEGSQTP